MASRVWSWTLASVSAMPVLWSGALQRESRFRDPHSLTLSRQRGTFAQPTLLVPISSVRTIGFQSSKLNGSGSSTPSQPTSSDERRRGTCAPSRGSLVLLKARQHEPHIILKGQRDQEAPANVLPRQPGWLDSMLGLCPRKLAASGRATGLFDIGKM